jgi:hypothetical protein
MSLDIADAGVVGLVEQQCSDHGHNVSAKVALRLVAMIKALDERASKAEAAVERCRRFADRLHEMGRESFKESDQLYPPGERGRSPEAIRGFEQTTAGNGIIVCIDPDATF